MRLYSTKNTSSFVGLGEAIMKGLPNDNGLFMPEHFPKLSESFINNLKDYSFQEIAFEVSKTLFQGTIPENDLKEIIEKSITFPAPIQTLDNQTYVLELFHGPSLAFKDFGARFMAQIMSYFNRGNEKELVILVATSGDTGGAVASGFLKTPGTKVVILYPKGKVSMLQEKQLTTLGHNISALEVEGTFDDCQALVKQAFLDDKLNSQIRLTSANSINIARLVPQSFYYFEAFKQLNDYKSPITFVVPSGNYGNITAGLIAQKMGLPIAHFVAASNANDIVPHYLCTGNYNPRPSVRTLSNAMDVGNPSNFARMQDLFGFTWNNMSKNISGYSINDEATKLGIKEVFEKYNYIIDPHGAVGYLAFKAYQKINPDTKGIILETAHPSKFIDSVEEVINQKIDIPERLAILADKKKESVLISTKFDPFKKWLLENY
jgi:threonine synthase